jgi:putative transposase
MRKLACSVLEVLTRYQRGSEALALPGEPRPQYAPGTAKLQRCQAEAAELGVSLMTVRRMIWRFEADDPVGLIDRRRQRRNDPLAGPTPAGWPWPGRSWPSTPRPAGHLGPDPC